MSRFTPYRFAVLTYQPMIQPLMDAFDRDSRYTLDYFSMSYDTPTFGIRRLLDQGYEVVLLYSAFGVSVVSAIGHSVVVIPRTDLDIIKALVRAREASASISLCVHVDEHIDTAFIEQLLSIKINRITYATLKEIKHKLRVELERGVDVMVGGGIAAALVQEYDTQFFIITPNRHCITQAVEQACGVAKAKREERESKAQLMSILRLFPEGVICVDQEGDIVFSNNTAYRLLKIKKNRKGNRDFSAYYQQLMISDVLADGMARNDTIITLNGEQLVVTTLPVSISQGMQGAVAFISDAAIIQNITGKLREAQQKIGFTAHFTLADIQGQTPAMLRLKKMVQTYAPHDVAAYIYGETGTGKEMVAQAMHNAGPRKDFPFVAVNCAALPESLLESELFGYEEGAFTGARRGGKPGVFELAHKGTLFLDEVGDMGAGAQLRLLRILETKKLVRVGGGRVIPVDIRVISASHKSLSELVKNGLFRQDLFYRLAVLRLHLPPLRQRMGDIPLLLGGLLQRYGKKTKDITPAMMEGIEKYSWPGNVRELHAFIASYLILLGTKRSDQSLFFELLQAWKSDSAATPDVDFPEIIEESETLKDQLHAVRRQIILETVRRCGGNKHQAAARLRISYYTLWRILRMQPGDEL